MRNALLIVLALCFATACGSKGPLYLPDSKPPPKTQKPVAPAATDSGEKRPSQ